MSFKKKDKELIENLILECKQEQEWKERYKQNFIEFDNYFKYSGKVEEFNEEYRNHEKQKKKMQEMYKDNNYKLSKEVDKYKEIIKQERAENYEKYIKPKIKKNERNKN
jgi:hypothetical protein